MSTANDNEGVNSPNRIITTHIGVGVYGEARCGVSLSERSRSVEPTTGAMSRGGGVIVLPCYDLYVEFLAIQKQNTVPPLNGNV